MVSDEEEIDAPAGAESEVLRRPERLEHHASFESAHLEADRDIVVHLPADYAASDRSYPVLYMHDGQNLFDPATAFGGQPWNVGETADRLAADGEIEPLIIVGIYNTGETRIDEYTPAVDRKHARGGKGKPYSRFVLEELKPFIDATYRTLPDRENTGIAGSSLGGLITLYIGLHHPDVFSRLGLLSPSVWWNRRMILRLVRSLEHSTAQKVWLDVGTAEGAEALRNVRDLRELLAKKGWTEGEDLAYVEDPGAGHDERAWGSRFGDALRFLYRT